MRTSLMIGLLILLAACGREQQDGLQQPFTADGVTFTLTPSAARDCDPDTVYEALVAWQVAQGRTRRVEIRLDSAEGSLFARSNDPEGSARTGPWVQRGMWFLLIDRDSGAVLAAQRAGPERCD